MVIVGPLAGIHLYGETAVLAWFVRDPSLQYLGGSSQKGSVRAKLSESEYGLTCKYTINKLNKFSNKVHLLLPIDRLLHKNNIRNRLNETGRHEMIVKLPLELSNAAAGFGKCNPRQ
jgi:hypothetical protein